MKNIWCDNMSGDNDSVWMVGNNYNALFKLDFVTKEYEFITKFPDEQIAKFRVNQLCKKIGNDIYFFPDCGDYIWTYSILDKSFKKIMLENPNNVRIGINMVYQVGNSIYAISNGLEQIIEINIDNQIIIGKYPIDESIQLYGSSSEGCVVNGNIFFTIPEKNTILEFNTKEKSIDKYEILGEFFPQTICYAKNTFWLTGRTKEIVKWDPKTNQTVSLLDFPDTVGLLEFNNDTLVENTNDIRFKRPLFRWSVSIDKKIWFIPYTANKMVYLNTNNYEIDVCDIESEYEDQMSWSRIEKVKYRFECIFNGQFIFLYSFKNRQYLIIDTVTGSTDQVDIVLDNKSRRELYECIYREKKVINENESISVLDILDIFVNIDEGTRNEDIGKRIYQSL